MFVEVGFRSFACLVKLMEDVQVGKAIRRCLIGIGPGFFIIEGFNNLFGGFGIGPEIRRLGYFFFFCY
jgi:hypothetical protein